MFYANYTANSKISNQYNTSKMNLKPYSDGISFTGVDGVM